MLFDISDSEKPKKIVTKKIKINGVKVEASFNRKWDIPKNITTEPKVIDKKLKKLSKKIISF